MTDPSLDLGAFLAFLSAGPASVEALVARYLTFHGRLYFGHLQWVFQRLREAVAISDPATATGLAMSDVILPDSRIAPRFLERYAPAFRDAYYAPAPLDRFERLTLFPASPNEWRDSALPAPFNIRLGAAERPRVDLLRGRAPSLFVSPQGCQLFDMENGTSWPAASSRAFARSIASYPQRHVEAPVAVIQDAFEATNVAHFLFDYVPRILHIAERLPDFARRCVFVIGGEPSEWHRLILDRIRALHALRPEQFIFPRQPEIWGLSDDVVFCSDQNLAHTHPLHMCHPRTMRMLRDLLDPRHLPSGTPERVLISRQDAARRRLVNETELADALAPGGFVPVRMSALDVPTQIATLARARHVIAPHGMGLAPLAFNEGGESLLELFNERIGTDAYAFIARALGIKYQFSTGTNQNDATLDYAADVGRITELASVHFRACAPGQPAMTPTPPAAPMGDAELVLQFESLGDNCEFGLVQRFVGAEPLGFFRFNSASLPMLTRMLETEFHDIDNPEDIELVRASPADTELIVQNRRFGYRYHTFRHDPDPTEARKQQLKVIPFLRNKLLADLRAGEKIFVRKGARSIEEAAALARLMRRYGPTTLLWITPEDEANPRGSVRVLETGLMQGFMDRLAPPRDAYDLSPTWLTVCRNAYALHAGGCPRGTTIMPPLDRRTVNLLRQVHLGSRKADWWVSAGSTAREPSEGVPARTHPDSPVIEHVLTDDAGPATSSLCGVVLNHGLVAGAPYVLSMDLWITEEASIERAGAVFTGLTAVQYGPANPARRNCWQRVWVAGRAPFPEAHVNASLFAFGQAGSRLYSTAWQLEIGHTPSAYAPSTAGTLPNRGPSPGSFRERSSS